MDEFFYFFSNLLKASTIQSNEYIVESDGTVLHPDTIKLVEDIQEFIRQQLIDQALRERNRDAFLKLTAR